MNKTQQSQTTLSMSQPASPKFTKQTNNNDEANADETTNEFSKKTRAKYKSFKGFTSSFSTSPKVKQKNATNAAIADSSVTTATSLTAMGKQNFLKMPANASFKSHSNKDLSMTSVNNIEVNFQRQLLFYNQHNEVSNSDYIELEFEIEKISYHLDKLLRGWTKIQAFNTMVDFSSLKSIVQTKIAYFKQNMTFFSFFVENW